MLMFVVMSAGGKPSSVKQPPPPLPPVILMVWAALEPMRPPAGSAGATCVLAKAGPGIAGMWQEPRELPLLELIIWGYAAIRGSMIH